MAWQQLHLLLDSVGGLCEKSKCIKVSEPGRLERRRASCVARVTSERIAEIVGPSRAQSLSVEGAAPESASLIQGDVVDTLQEAAKSARSGQSLTETTESVTQAANEAVESVKNLSNQAFDSVKDLSGTATESASQSLKATSELLSATANDLTQQTQSTLNALKMQLDALGNDTNEGIQSAIASLEEAIAVLKTQVVDAVPPEVKESIELARPYIQSASEFAVTYRIPLLIAFAPLLGYAGFTFYTYRFAGYSGDIYPDKVLELLQSDAPALLVDVRSEEAQRRDGIPKLRRKALGKGISIPFIQPDPSLRRQINVTPQLKSDLTAAYIAGHRQASSFTSFVILARDGDQGRSVARSLVKMECMNAYVMLGGLAAWKSSGLPISESSVYEITPIDVVADKALDVTEILSEPSNLVPISAAVVGTAWVIWNYHFVLQLLGVLGPLSGLVFYTLKKYDTLDELMTDLDATLKTFAAATETRAAAQPASPRTLPQITADTSAENKTESEQELVTETESLDKTEAASDTNPGSQSDDAADDVSGTNQQEEEPPSIRAVDSNEPVVADS